MPKLTEMAKNARRFLDDIWPQSFRTGATYDAMQKQFAWALYCEKLVSSLEIAGKLDDFKILAEISDDLEVDFLYNAIARLLENYLHNPRMTDAELLQVFTAASQVVDKETLNGIISSLTERNTLYQQALSLAQTIDVIKLKSLLMRDSFQSLGNQHQFSKKLLAVVENITGMELFLNLYLETTTSDKSFSNKLRDFLCGQLRNWLENNQPCAGIINSLLASPVNLTRTVCVQDSSFLDFWLRVLSTLASNLRPQYYQHEHDWVWPPDEDTSEKFHGIWFAFQQLSRHFSSLLILADEVSDKAWNLIQTKQGEVNGSLWLDLCQNLPARCKGSNKPHT